MKKNRIGIVVPAYNERDVLKIFHEQLCRVIDKLPFQFLILYVDDGSCDDSFKILKMLQKEDSRINLLELSRNFGKEIAITAGLDALDREAVDAAIVMDCDLQDPPDVIPEFLEKWLQGFDVVYGRRRSRNEDGFAKRIGASAFYSLMQNVGDRVRIPKNVGDFRLLGRAPLHALVQLRERHRFMKGLFAWIGFSQREVIYDRPGRRQGGSKWSFFRLLGLAIDAITSFTIFPLKFATYLGVIVSISSITYGVYIVVKTIVFGNAVPGYPSLITVMLFIGGVQLLAIGIMGEYIGRIFNETKNRPLYFVKEYLPGGRKGERGKTTEFAAEHRPMILHQREEV